MMSWDSLIKAAVSTLVFGGIGMLLFGLAFFIITRIAPFSIRKEIQDDQNTTLGILIGAVILGIAIIVAAAVHG